MNRRRPARAARIGALVVTCAATGGLAALFADLDRPPATQAGPDPPATIATVAPGAPGGTSASGVAAFDGDAVATRFGPVEVQAQLRDGRLVDVAVVEYPDADRRSAGINADALPQLRAEALDAQRADVDSVSGATYTSEGYAWSLQSALDRARDAGALR